MEHLGDDGGFAVAAKYRAAKTQRRQPGGEELGGCQSTFHLKKKEATQTTKAQVDNTEATEDFYTMTVLWLAWLARLATELYMHVHVVIMCATPAVCGGTPGPW